MKRLILLISLVALNVAYAADYYLQDNGETEVFISREGINRVKVFYDRIKDIRANTNELSIETDKARGEIYIKPYYSISKSDIYLTTENNLTYKLTLKVKDVASQQIFINRDTSFVENNSSLDTLRREKLKLINKNLYFNFEEDYKLASINLIRAMSSRANLKDFSIVKRKSQILWYNKLYRVKWLYSYIVNNKGGVSGEIAEIENLSKQEINLKEEAFLTRGIRGVRLEKLRLQPGEIGYLYLIGGDEDGF